MLKKILIFIISIPLLFLAGCVILFIIFLVNILNPNFEFPDYKITTNPAEYQKSTPYSWWSKETKHFPRKIPAGATNIKLYLLPNGPFGSRELYLKFDIDDKEFIEKEIQKNSYVAVLDYEKIEYPKFSTPRFNEISHDEMKDMTFYIIFSNFEEYHLLRKSFPSQYGIAVNKKGNSIFYYYECSDIVP